MEKYNWIADELRNEGFDFATAELVKEVLEDDREHEDHAFMDCVGELNQEWLTD